MERRFFGRIVRGFGLEVIVEGEPLKPAMFVTNHISWADIPVLAAALDADFVAKSDIQRWPVIGPLARRYGPVFIAREHRSGSHSQAHLIRARLRAGRSVILCPEGTTSDGTSILPFRTSLFAAADAADVVQPVVIRYLAIDGSALSPERQRAVAWIGDDELVTGAARVSRERTLVRLTFLEPLRASCFHDRKSLAEAARTGMLEAYAAAPKRPKWRAEMAETGITMKTSTVLNGASITAPSPTIAPTRR
jgi:1-acyl-sn-glycerol-3-phosphate acyltransferase